MEKHPPVILIPLVDVVVAEVLMERPMPWIVVELFEAIEK